MTTQKGWMLKGKWYESCLANGQCPILFQRDITTGRPCAGLQAWQITEGQIENVDMTGIIIMNFIDGIGPSMTERNKGLKEIAQYISDNASEEQRRVLEPFVRNHFIAERCIDHLGVKFVKINISEENNSYHVSMPFGELKLSLTIGGDGKTPILIENTNFPFVTVYRVANAQYWKYHDHGKDLEVSHTSATVSDFSMQGD